MQEERIVYMSLASVSVVIPREILANGNAEFRLLEELARKVNAATTTPRESQKCVDKHQGLCVPRGQPINQAMITRIFIIALRFTPRLACQSYGYASYR